MHGRLKRARRAQDQRQAGSGLKSVLIIAKNLRLLETGDDFVPAMIHRLSGIVGEVGRFH